MLQLQMITSITSARRGGQSGHLGADTAQQSSQAPVWVLIQSIIHWLPLRQEQQACWLAQLGCTLAVEPSVKSRTLPGPLIAWPHHTGATRWLQCKR